MIGGLLNALPFVVTMLLVRLLSSDHDHPASAAIVTGPPVFAIAHGLQLLFVGLTGSAALVLLYLLMLVPCTMLALKCFDYLFGVGTKRLP